MSGGGQLNWAADEASAAAMYSMADRVRGRDDHSAKSTANYMVRVNHAGSGDENHEGRAEASAMVRVNCMDGEYVSEGASSSSPSYSTSTSTSTAPMDNSNSGSDYSSSSNGTTAATASSNRASSWHRAQLRMLTSRLHMMMSRLRSNRWPTNIPRRVAHPLKVGLALSVVSLSILHSDIYKKLGSNAIWAVMTVVLVFELTAGATFYKGLNRALGTLFAGILSLIVELLADSIGPRGEPYVIGISVFVVGVTATYARYSEAVKSKCEYGAVVFLLSFSMIVVSGYREEGNDLGIAVARFLTILLGVGVCMAVSVLVWPAWAGDDLHNTIAHNFAALSAALEDSVMVYFRRTRVCCDDPLSDPSYLQKNNIILCSRAKEESLANFAHWEPKLFEGNSSNIVWKQYLEVGGKLRSCSYIVASLHACFRSSVQVPFALRKAFSNPCFNIGIELAKLIKELGKSVKRREEVRSKDELMGSLLEKVENFKKDMNACTILLLGVQRTNLLRKELLVTPQSWWPPLTHHVNEEKVQLSSHNICQVHKKLVETYVRDWQNTISENLVEETKCTCKNTSVTQISIHSSQLDVQDHDGKIEVEAQASFGDFLSMASIAFLLIELVLRVEHLVEAVKSLERLASFKRKESLLQKVTPQPLREDFHDGHLLVDNDPQHSYITIKVM